MNTITAYRRISSWNDEKCHPFKDSPLPCGLRYRPLIMSAAASLSGKLGCAKTDEDLFGCVQAYERMIRNGETSTAALERETIRLRDELMQSDLPEHQLN